MDLFAKSHSTRNRIGIALSGGIDSTIAGWLVKQNGFEPVGLYLSIFEEEKGLSDAQKAADFLGIPLKIFDVRGQFRTQIVKPFINAYLSGKTPNPCVFCNAMIKCGLLLDWALENGLHTMVTGHYARIKLDRNTGNYFLLRGSDPKKDQSYFLYRLTQKQLAHLTLPLGTRTKRSVEDLAGTIGLGQKKYRESQEICFLAPKDYRLFLKQTAPCAFRPGPVYDRFGNMLGIHSGLPGYTIGQRKGLNLIHQGPHYVLAIDFKQNRIIVGKDEDLWEKELVANHINKIVSMPWPKKVMTQIRSNQAAQEAILEHMCDGRIRVLFCKPVRAISPGQSVVFYNREICLGGGIIQ